MQGLRTQLPSRLAHNPPRAMVNYAPRPCSNLFRQRLHNIPLPTHYDLNLNAPQAGPKDLNTEIIPSSQTIYLWLAGKEGMQKDASCIVEASLVQLLPDIPFERG